MVRDPAHEPLDWLGRDDIDALGLDIATEQLYELLRGHSVVTPEELHDRLAPLQIGGTP